MIGNPAWFAIESVVTCAYERLSLRALGYFVLHVGGVTYGVRTSDATLLACSFDGIVMRLEQRGQHCAPFAEEADAAALAEAVEASRYGSEEPGWQRFGYSRTELDDLLLARGTWWAPDGDAAFDDGSRVVQFDVGDRVRIVGFKRSRESYFCLDDLRDVWLDSGQFYGILEEWKAKFEAEWLAAPKTPHGS